MVMLMLMPSMFTYNLENSASEGKEEETKRKEVCHTYYGPGQIRPNEAQF